MWGSASSVLDFFELGSLATRPLRGLLDVSPIRYRYPTVRYLTHLERKDKQNQARAGGPVQKAKQPALVDALLVEPCAPPQGARVPDTP